MEFFNRKEEIIEIQMTQEGKRLLAKSEFKPFYYEFFDDDILYDTDGSGFSELQNESVPRIKETPRIKTQNIIYGVETEFNKLKQLKEIKENKEKPGYKPTYTKNYLYNKNHDSLKCALGLGDYSLNHAPSWNLSLVTGLINTSSFSTTYSPEADYYEYIPQINCTCSYIYEARSDMDNYFSLPESIGDKIIFKSEIFKDELGLENYYVIREQNNLHFILKELNSTFDKENFDIEVFLVEESEGQKENLNNLFFISNEKIDLNNENFIEQKINEKDIEWYFTLSKDDEASEKETTEQIDIYADNNADNSQEPC